MWGRALREVSIFQTRSYSRIQPPVPVGPEPGSVIRVLNNVARLGDPKEGPKPRQLLSLPPFPGQPLAGKKKKKNNNNTINANTSSLPTNERPPRVTAVSWVKYYFDEVEDRVIHSHFRKGLVQMECSDVGDSVTGAEVKTKPMTKIKPGKVMEDGARVYVSVSVAESRVSRRFDVIPSGTLYPNADEIAYLQRLVFYKDSAIIVLNKPPKLPVKGHLPIHNSMDALAAAALSFDYDEPPKLVHRLDRESSGLILMGRTKESIRYLEWLFSEAKGKSLSKPWNDAREETYQKYWALVIGSPKEKEGIICAPLSKVVLNDGKTERIILAHNSGFEVSQKAMTEYRVLGPMINGCSWLELRPLTSRKHQLRVHCAEALGTPIVGDYKYGWFVHKKWKHTTQVNIEPTSGKPYKLRRPDRLDIQKGSVMSKVPLLHLHSREIVLPNIANFVPVSNSKSENKDPSKPDLLRFVAPMPSHMKISWNLMSSYLI